MLCKHKENWDIELAPVYCKSSVKTVTNSKYMLDKSFQEILYRIDNWINEGSGWVIESVDAEYVNISIFSSLLGSTYNELPRRLKTQWKVWLILKSTTINAFFSAISDI